MADNSIDRLPLRDLILGAHQFTRELEEHLGQGFLPKVEKLEVAIRPADQEKHPINDVTVRRQVQELLESHDFADRLMTKVQRYLTAIENSLQENVLSES